MENPYKPQPFVTISTPEWAKEAAIYQINTRQFTPEGTFQAAEKHLPRLKELGVDILWLMPVHEIGVQNRKGSLGSPYSVRDYYSVNPEFGTKDDLKHFISRAQASGFRVILDWVPNHTAWDNPLVQEHPEWYARDWKGDFRPTPWWDWDDIIELDYSHTGLREYMAEAMTYWIREVGFDGFRMDVAGFVPNDFWARVRKELDEIKPVFMLAEWDARDLHAKAFDMTYAWSWWDAVKAVSTGGGSLQQLFMYYSWNERAYPDEAIRMTFVTNHDKNAWEGTMFENFGHALEAAIALSVVGEGMPLIYNGQEAGNDRALAFFEKDPIEWKDHPIGTLYRKMIRLMKENQALWHGRWGGRMIRVPNSSEEKVISFVRMKNGNKVFAVINFSEKEKEIQFSGDLFPGSYLDTEAGNKLTLKKDSTLKVQPGGFRIFTARPGS
ncbi:alpha-amylase family glycosyl hydrolase [Rhodohalobacter mucosus]|uniref:Alpha-amlyase n=1 Tax=Rhodohalobacter mucosus TaxID=2079485 RepID=A0A316TRK0_9BACT|nr:alpha-amylase family glycosyl hydrolase [Rhodohalobacter mucosus]PWN06281.1 alpha-amlyase [Rhodohalobacter mucosus]